MIRRIDAIPRWKDNMLHTGLSAENEHQGVNVVHVITAFEAAGRVANDISIFDDEEEVRRRPRLVQRGRLPTVN